MTKSSASDNLLHVNCNVTNRTQTCFRRLFTRCVGTRCYIEGPFISLLLLLKVCFAYLFIVRFVFQVFCSLLWCFLHRRKCCWLQIPLWYAVFNKVCEITLSEMLATHMGVMGAALTSARLKCTNLIYFRLTAGRFRGNSCIVMFWVTCELLQFAATQ